MSCNVKHVQTSAYLSYYLTSNCKTICRICLEKSSKLMPIFDAIKPPHFSILIMACAAVHVSQGDNLPQNICPKCLSKLNIAFQFKTQCEIADAKLRQSFENMIHNQESPQLNDANDNDTLTTLALEEQEKTSEVLVCSKLLENTTTIKMESSELSSIEMFNKEFDQLPSHNERLLLNSESILQDFVPANVVEFNTNEAINTSNTQEKEPQNVDISNKQKPNMKTPTIKNHRCHICTKVFRTKPSLVHHIRIHTGERPYVCHLCDKRFINGGHLHTHMRTHTGEKNHVCVACPNKAFATAQQLTKHTIAIHTAERPYSCPYCPKRFASSSNLNTHVKIHTGEKNYYCEQCGKAFSTKGQLDQHMLVHTGEKAFMCEFCQKRFSQKAHLVRHLKLHRNESIGRENGGNG